jgi:hypothetical protein
MQEQRASVKQPDILSWQYVVLMVAIALLVVLVAAVPVTIQRADQPTSAPQVASGQDSGEPATGATSVAPPAAGQAAATPTLVQPTAVPVVAAPLTATDFDQHYEDETGVAFDYPSDWFTGMPQPGYVLLTNFPQDVQSLPDNWAIIGIQVGTLADLAGSDGVAPEPGTSPRDLVQSILDSNNLSDLEIQEMTVDGQPAARVHVVNQGREFEFVLATPNENRVVTIRGEVTEGGWETASALFDRFLESLTLNIPAS